MKVSELIAILEQFNQDAPVEIQYINSCADWGVTKAYAGIGTVQITKETNWQPERVTITTNESD